MSLQRDSIVIDCTDPMLVASFWSEALGLELHGPNDDDDLLLASIRSEVEHVVDEEEPVHIAGCRAVRPVDLVASATFSKAVFPALRLGYPVVPRALVSEFVHIREWPDICAPTLYQLVLHGFP